MAKYWVNGGKWMLCGGKYAVQDNCPCCYLDVIGAIRERQAMLGRTVWAAVPSPAKLLADCINETNAMAPSFVAGTYAGGTGAPTMRSGSYATGVTDFCDLLELLKALTTTRNSYGLTTAYQGSLAFYQSTSTASTLAMAIAWALQNAYRSDSRNYVLGQSMWAFGRTGTVYKTIALECAWGDVSVGPLYAGPKRSLELWCKALPPNRITGTKVYDRQGVSWLPDQPYVYALAGALSMAAGETTALFPSPCPDTAPPNAVDPAPDTTVNTGFALGESFVLVDWEFTYR